MELYNNPANQFMAGFPGSPSMNFLPGDRLHGGDERTIGIRPADLLLSDTGALTAQVSQVEQLGGDTNVIAHVQDHQITARLFGQHAIQAGHTVRLGFDAAKTYAFDRDGHRVATQ